MKYPKKSQNCDHKYKSNSKRPLASKSTIYIVSNDINNTNTNNKQDHINKKPNELMRLFFYGELSFQFYYNLTHFFLDSLGWFIYFFFLF